MKIKSRIFLLALTPLLFTGCGLILDIMVPIDKPCKVKINKRRVKSSCDLVNGVQFEKLKVFIKDSIGLPSEYYIVSRFQLSNINAPKVQKYWPKQIHFLKTNGHYKWSIDTVNTHVKVIEYGERISLDTPKVKTLGNHLFLNTDKYYSICPVNFSEDTWYYVIFPNEASGYLYVDKKSKFRYHTN